MTAASRTIVFVASWRQYCSTCCTAARNPPRHRIDRFGAPKHLRDIRLEAVIGDRDRLPAIRSSPTRRSLEPASARLLRSPPSALFHESSLFRLGLARSTRELSASAPARRFASGGVVAVGRIGDKPPTIFRDAALTRSTLTSHRSFLQIAPVIVSTPWRRTPQSQQQVSVQSGRRPCRPHKSTIRRTKQMARALREGCSNNYLREPPDLNDILPQLTISCHRPRYYDRAIL